MLLLSAAGAFTPRADAAPRKAPVAVSTASPAALGREAVAVLAGRSDDPDPEVRAVVAAAWGDLGNAAAIPRLKKSLADDNADVRIAAAASLTKLGDVQGLLALIDATKPIMSGRASSPAEELRRMARDAARARAALKLGEAGGDAGIEALRSLLGDPAGEVRDAAAAALARAGQGDSSQFVDALKDPDEGVRAAGARSLGIIGRDGLEPLKKALSSDASASVRAEAAEALGSFSDPASERLLSAALKDKSGRVRLAAARALGRRLDPASTAALKNLADQSPPPEMGLTVAAALAARGEPFDLSLPELTLGQKDAELKLLAVAALARSKAPQARDLLVKAMREDPDSRVRAAAAADLISELSRGRGTH
ncbi:MAG: HEAT repeat domain-containing protein [Elusimicrobia bacterium]|nr:HEAT repeat domain-containing protein [Elusimicrobiota bacterium]